MIIYKNTIVLNRKDYQDKAAICILKIDDKLSESINSNLHPEEITHYNALKYDRRKVSYLSGRLAAKYALELLGIDKTTVAITSGVFHFPVIKYLKAKSVKVSISHCNDYACAVAFPEEHPMGVDIEKIDVKKVKTITSVLTDEEMLLINTASKTDFTMLWTAKESLSKVLKTGLMIDFKLLEIKSFQKEGDVVVMEFVHFSQYKAIAFKFSEFVCTVALPRNTTIASLDILSDFCKNN